ncbi:hypothetical protein BLNAU_23334 [Blattamonas nauphoetae]|uniref:Uncharacterized protein n=1 Tax=Blattamonas nauphoetae TaxID=2049346 RepID=A0ABQ9WQI0_9EUKA|nr:hypothetical protein BLNAU_23334 [Blattamonas nauphoetae]
MFRLKSQLQLPSTASTDVQHCENDQERRRCEGNKREGDEDQQFEVDEDIEGEYEQAEKEDEGTRSMGENEEVEENEHEQTGEMEKVEENDNAEDKQEEAVEDEVNKTMEMPMTTYKNLSNQNAKAEMLRNSMKKYAKIPDLNRMHMGKKTMMMKLSKTNISTMKFMTRPVLKMSKLNLNMKICRRKMMYMLKKWNISKKTKLKTKKSKQKSKRAHLAH